MRNPNRKKITKKKKFKFGSPNLDLKSLRIRTLKIATTIRKLQDKYSSIFNSLFITNYVDCHLGKPKLYNFLPRSQNTTLCSMSSLSI